MAGLLNHSCLCACLVIQVDTFDTFLSSDCSGIARGSILLAEELEKSLHNSKRVKLIKFFVGTKRPHKHSQ